MNVRGNWNIKIHISFCFIQTTVERENYCNTKIHKIYAGFQPISKVNVESRRVKQKYKVTVNI